MWRSLKLFLIKLVGSYPLLWPLLAYIVGLLLSEGLSEQLRKLPWGVVGVAGAGIGVLLWKISRPQQRSTFLYIGAVWGMLTILLSYALLRRESPEKAFPSDTKSYRAYLLRTPTLKAQSTSYTFLLQADLCYLGEGRFASTSARLRLNYYAQRCPFQVGDQVWVQGRPKRISTHSSEYSYATVQARRSIFFEDYASAKKVVPTGTTKGNWLWIHAQQLRKYFCEDLEKWLSEEGASLAQGLLLGEKATIDKDLQKAFAATGSMHLLAVSGLHVGILSVLWVFVITWIPLGRYSLLVRLLIVVVALWGFAFLVGLSASVVRATLLYTLFSLAQWMGRRTNSYNSLFAAALVILLVDPRSLFSLSFQLSFLAVLGILLFYKPLYSRWRPRQKWMQLAWGGVCVSIAAQLAVCPLVVYHFQMFSLIFPLTNLLLMPLLFVVLPLTLGVVALPWIASILAPLLELLLQFMAGVIRQSASLPGSYLYPIHFSETQIWILYAVLSMATCFLLLRRPVFVLTTAGLLLVHLAVDWQRSHYAHSISKLRLSVNRRNELLLQHLHQGVVRQTTAAGVNIGSVRFLQKAGLYRALGEHPTLVQPLVPVVDEILYATSVGKKRLLWLKGHALKLGRKRGPILKTDILVLSRQRPKDIPLLLARLSFRTAVLAYSSTEVVRLLRNRCDCQIHLLAEEGPYYTNLLSYL